MAKPDLLVLLAAPRGFCAGVVRALETVELALEIFGPPIYVHHEIVHNPHVVAGLRQRGVVFVETLDVVPVGSRIVISAHGAAPSVFEQAGLQGLQVVDATCPLVTKVHREVANHVRHGRHVILIGHRRHAEIIGTAGHAGSPMTIIETVAEAAVMPVLPGRRYAYATQTTLALRDTAAIVEVLRNRIPDLAEPPRSDICYATSNRQTAVAAIAKRCDGIIVIGGANSSNSRQLVEVARQSGCSRLWFVSRGSEAPVADFDGLRSLGIASGASTPESLVDELLAALGMRFAVTVEIVETAIETQHYRPPPLKPLEPRTAGWH